LHPPQPPAGGQQRGRELAEEGVRLEVGVGLDVVLPGALRLGRLGGRRDRELVLVEFIFLFFEFELVFLQFIF